MLVQTREQFNAVVTILLESDVIAVDTETTGLNPWYGDKLIGIAFYCRVSAHEEYFLNAYLPFRHAPSRTPDLFSHSENLPVEWLRDLACIFKRIDPPEWVFHNAKFDLAILYNEDLFRWNDAYGGYKINGKITDTSVLAHVVNENGSHRLKDLAAKYYGHDERKAEAALKKLLGNKNRYFDTHPKQMEEYACKDAELTYRLREEFLPAIDKQELTHLLDREEEFTRCLFDLERQGIRVDSSLAKTLSAEVTSQMRSLEDEMGFDPGKRVVLARKLFAAPPEGLGLLPGPFSDTPSPEFPKGIPVMDEEVLSSLDAPLASLVLQYRGLVKANSTWYQKFTTLAERAGDGRIHPTYNQNGTRTSRLSASNPNVQQLPRKGDGNSHLRQRVRALMLPDEDYELWEYDYSQIELRLAAAYAKDEPFIEAFRSNSDPHQILADSLGVSRQAAKHGAYTTLYGGGPERLAETLEKLHRQTTGVKISFPVEEAERILTGFFELHPAFRKLMRNAEYTAKRKGYVKLWTGRRRHFEFPHFHKAFNSIIQGGSAEIMKDTMLWFWRKQQAGIDYRMAAQIHDSLWFCIPPDRPDIHEEIKEGMEWPGRLESFVVPFPVEAKLMSGSTMQLASA